MYTDRPHAKWQSKHSNSYGGGGATDRLSRTPRRAGARPKQRSSVQQQQHHHNPMNPVTTNQPTQNQRRENPKTAICHNFPGAEQARLESRSAKRLQAADNDKTPVAVKARLLGDSPLPYGQTGKSGAHGRCCWCAVHRLAADPGMTQPPMPKSPNPPRKNLKPSSLSSLE